MLPWFPLRRPFVSRQLVRRALLLVPIALAAAGPAGAQAADTLTVGTYAYAANDRVAAVTPLAQHLGRRLGRPVRVQSFPDPPTLARAVRDGSVDVAVTNTFGYLLLATSPSPAAFPVATFRIRAGERSNYGSVLVADAAAADSVPQLRDRAAGLRLALVAPGSTTGSLVPRLFLAAAGLPDAEGSFRQVAYGDTHVGTLALLRSGAADVAALATEEYERQVAAGGEAASAWRVLWRSPDITLGPVAVRSTLPPALRREIARHVVGLEKDDPRAFEALRGGWVEARNADALVAADDATYDEVRRLFGDPATAAALIERFSR